MINPDTNEEPCEVTWGDINIALSLAALILAIICAIVKYASVIDKNGYGIVAFISIFGVSWAYKRVRDHVIR